MQGCIVSSLSTYEALLGTREEYDERGTCYKYRMQNPEFEADPERENTPLHEFSPFSSLSLPVRCQNYHCFDPLWVLRSSINAPYDERTLEHYPQSFQSQVAVLALLKVEAPAGGLASLGHNVFHNLLVEMASFEIGNLQGNAEQTAKALIKHPLCYCCSLWNPNHFCW